MVEVNFSNEIIYIINPQHTQTPIYYFIRKVYHEQGVEVDVTLTTFIRATDFQSKSL